MLVKSLLLHLVVIRRHRQNPIDANCLQLARHCNHFRGVVSTSSRNHRHAPLRHLHRDRNHPHMLLVCQRRALPRRPTRHEKINSCFNLSRNQLPQRRLIQRSIAAKWSHHRRPASCKHHRLLLVQTQNLRLLVLRLSPRSPNSFRLVPPQSPETQKILASPQSTAPPATPPAQIPLGSAPYAAT